MMSNEEISKILERYSKLGKIGNKEILEKIPKEERSYKCHVCYSIVDKIPCPICNETKLEIMCPLDHCECGHDVVTKIAYCPLCGDPVCPECLCHDVSTVSRVTGYLSDVGGWNNAKKQELKDRVRHNMNESGSEMIKQ